MTVDDKQTTDTFKTLQSELETYLGESERSLVYICHAIADRCYHLAASASDPPERGLSPEYLEQSLLTALELARLRVGPGFLSSVLLYYPASAGFISSPLLEMPPTPGYVSSLPRTEIPVTTFTQEVHKSLVRLLDIGRVFDPFLPWNREDETVKNLLKQRTQLASKAGEVGRQSERDHINDILLKALFSTKIPEIPVVKAVERLNLLEHVESLLPDPNIYRMLAQEALDVHAQAAEILGVHSIKWRLEDLAFSILWPDEFNVIVADLRERREQRENSIRHAINILTAELADNGIEAEVSGRPKHIYGLYLKQIGSKQSIQEINDNLGLRIIVSSEVDCYAALDVLHRLWKTVPGIYGDVSYRDWIVTPKANGYQSIHTTVYYAEDNDRLLEVQIRTREMHETAEYGVAAHWVYKKGKGTSEKQKQYYRYVEEMANFRRQLEEHQHARRT